MFVFFLYLLFFVLLFFFLFSGEAMKGSGKESGYVLGAGSSCALIWEVRDLCDSCLCYIIISNGWFPVLQGVSFGHVRL